jgi:hypothetical protein
MTNKDKNRLTWGGNCCCDAARLWYVIYNPVLLVRYAVA